MHAIKKYPNRRMYDALLKKYVNLDEVMGFIQQGDTVQITDSQTGIDVTVETLLFHICNSELLSILCPVDWLFQLARLQEGDERRQYLSYCLVTRHIEPESVTEEHSSENTEVMYTRKISPNSKKYSMEEVSSDEEMIEKSVPRDDSDDMDDMDDISDNPMKNTKIPSLYVVRNTVEPSGHTTHHDVPEVVPPKAQEPLEMVDADLPEEQTTPKEENSPILSPILPIEEPENANLVFVHPEIPIEEKAPVDIGVFEHIASIEVAHVSEDVFSTTGEEKDVSSTQMEEAVIAEVPSTNTETQEAEVDMSSAKARLMALQARFKK